MIKKLITKNLKYGLMSALTILLVFGILIFIILFSMNHHKRFDMTKNKRFSLDNKSVNVVSSLNKDVEVLVFYGKGGDFKQRARNILDQYTYYTKKLKVRFLETNRNPMLAKELELKNPNSLVVKTPKKKEVLTSIREEDLSNALIKVTQDKQIVVGFVVGHGERPAKTGGGGSESGKSFSFAYGALEKENYLAETVNILGEKGIPDNIELLIIAGPQSPYLDKEIEKLKEHVKSGKSLMVMLEPSQKFENKNLIAMIKTYGIEVKDEVVLDKLGIQFFGNPFVAVVPVNLYGKHRIVKDFDINTFYPISRPLKLTMPPPKTSFFDVIAKTGPAPLSWAKKITGGMREKDLVYVKDKDMPGPINLAMAGLVRNSLESKDGKDARVVVFGNVNFACNEFILRQGNKNMFMNCVSWLTAQENLIRIGATKSEFTPLFLDKKQKQIIWTTTILIMPGLVLLAGAFMLLLKR